MRADNTVVRPIDRVIWSGQGVTITARLRGLDLSLQLVRKTEFDGGPARIFDLPGDAIDALISLLYERPLALGVGDVACTANLFRKCPVCSVANPCPRHSAADQIRAVDDPEYLESLLAPCNVSEIEEVERLKRDHPLTSRQSVDYGCGSDEFPA